MFHDKQGPIESFSWGMFVINGEKHGKTDDKKKGVGKDIRLVGKRISKWKERKGHELSFDMITGVFGHNIETLIIGIGVESRIECPEDVIHAIKEHGIPTVILKATPEACKLYNEYFRSGTNVALLAHGTC